MATLPTPKQQEEDELQQGLESMAPTLGANTIPGGLQTGQSWSTPMNQNRAPQRGGTGFVSLERYQQANRPALDRLGQGVVGQVTGAGESARGALSQGQQQFNTLVGQNEVRDQGLNQRLFGDALGIYNDQAARTQLERQRDATYTGPRSLEESDVYGGIAGAFAKAKDVGELAKSESGITELSKGAVTGNRSRGQAQFDTNLLLSDSGFRGNLERSRAGLDTLDKELQDASKASLDRVGQAQKTTEQTRQQTRSALTGAQDALQKAIDERVNQKRAEAAQRTTQAMDALRGVTYGKGQLPTSGVQGRYYENNDPTRGGFQDTAIAGNTPEFIHYTGGQALLPEFDRNAAAYMDAQRQAIGGKGQALADLGLTPDMLYALTNIAPAQELARASAIGTNNVNPYSFIEDYWGKLGDVTRFAKAADPNMAIQRENTASTRDYDEAAALKLLAADLGRNILDQTQYDQAGTASADLVDFDALGAGRAQESAIDALAKRAGAHIAGNARSGGDSFIKKYGVSLATGGLMPQGSSLKDVAKAAIPGTDQFKHIANPLTPLALPGGVGGLGVNAPAMSGFNSPLGNLGQPTNGYNDFTAQKLDNAQAISANELADLRRRGLL